MLLCRHVNVVTATALDRDGNQINSSSLRRDQATQGRLATRSAAAVLDQFSILGNDVWDGALVQHRGNIRALLGRYH